MYSYKSILTQQTGVSNPEVNGFKPDTIKNKTTKPVNKKCCQINQDRRRAVQTKNRIWTCQLPLDCKVEHGCLNHVTFIFV